MAMVDEDERFELPMLGCGGRGEYWHCTEWIIKEFRAVRMISWSEPGYAVT